MWQPTVCEIQIPEVCRTLRSVPAWIDPSYPGVALTELAERAWTVTHTRSGKKLHYGVFGSFKGARDAAGVCLTGKDLTMDEEELEERGGIVIFEKLTRLAHWQAVKAVVMQARATGGNGYAAA